MPTCGKSRKYFASFYNWAI